MPYSKLSYATPKSTYAGMPTEQIDETMGVLQNRYDDNLQAIDTIEVLAANLDVSENDQNLKDEAIHVLNEQINKMSKTGDYESLTPEIRFASKNLATNEGLNAAVKNKAAINKDRELIREMKSQGLDTLVFNDPDKFATYNDEGNIQTYQSDVQPRLDYDKRKQDIWGIIQEDAVAQGLITEEEFALIKNNQITQISATKIKNLNDYAYKRYMQTPEGQQERKKIVELDGTYTSKGEPIVWAEANIKQSLMDVGLMKVFKVEDAAYISDLERLNRAEATKARKTSEQELSTKSAYLGYTIGEAITNPAGLPPTSVEYDEMYSTQEDLIGSYTKSHNEAYTTSVDPNATDRERADAEIEAQKYASSILLEQAKLNNMTKIRGQDYYDYLRNPTDKNGDPIDPYLIQDMQLTNLEHEIVSSDDSVYKKDIFNETLNRYDDVSINMADDLLNVDTNPALANSDPANAQITLDNLNYAPVLSEVAKRKLRDSRDQVFLGRIISTNHHLKNHGVFGPSYLKGAFSGDFDGDKLARLRETLEDLKPIVSAYHKVNNEEYSDEYFATRSQYEHQPTVIDFSVDKEGKESTISKTLSAWVNNKPQEYTYIYEGNSLTYDEFLKVSGTTPEAANASFSVHGSTTWVPGGKGFLLAGKFNVKDRTNSNDKGKEGNVYVVPTKFGTVNSGVSGKIFNELLSNYYTDKGNVAIEKYGNVVDYAYQIVDDNTEQQLAPFYYTKQKPNTNLTTEFIVGDDGFGGVTSVDAYRETNERGETSYSIIDKQTGEKSVPNSSLLSFQNGLEALARDAVFVPMTDDTFSNINIDETQISESLLTGFKFKADFARKLYVLNNILPVNTSAVSLSRSMGNLAYSGGEHSIGNAMDLKLTPDLQTNLEANSIEDVNAPGWRILTVGGDNTQLMGLRYLIHDSVNAPHKHVHVENYNK